VTVSQPVAVPAGLALPQYGGSLADVLPTALGWLGMPQSSGLDIRGSGRVCVLLVDGLGWNGLRGAAESAPFLTSLLSDSRSGRITTVFPSTTPIALTSLGTGLPPGEHGITGFYLRVDGQILNLLAIPAEADLAVVQPRPTLLEQAERAGITVTRVGPRRFDGEGLTQAALRGGAYAAAESVGELVTAAGAAVRRGERSLTYVYVGSLDGTGHRRGCRGGAWLEELFHVDLLAERLAASLPADATLLVTSDHGMLDVPVENRTDVAATPELAAGVAAVTGDMRAVNVHAAPGAAGDVLAAWRESLGERFWVLSGAEAVASGLYGPTVREEFTDRIGDVVAVAAGDWALYDSRTLPAYVSRLVGLHGSVTEDELFVPLLVHGR
jgi:hypothetical protein